MAETNTIEHKGVVESVDENSLRIRIIQTSACASCSAKGHCTSADNKDKIIETAKPNFDCKPGTGVVITGAMSMGMQAVVIAFFVPFLILTISLFAAMHVTGGNEWQSSLIAFSLLVPYYLILRTKRALLKRKFLFTVKQ